MGYFASDAEVHDVLGGTFQHLAGDPELSEKLKKTDTVFTLQLEKPRATITVKLLPGQEAQVDLGTATIRPECAFQMDCDVAHQLFLGRLNPTGALSKGTIKTRGPVAKVLKVFPIVPTIAEAYEARITAAGREDLLAEEPPEVPAGKAIEEERKAAEAAAAAEADAAAPVAEEAAPASDETPAADAPAEATPAAEETLAGEEAPAADAPADEAPAADEPAPETEVPTEVAETAVDPAETEQAPGEDAPSEPAS